MSVTFKNEIEKFPPDILAGIGKIVAQWGYVEHQLRAVVRYATGLPIDTGRVLLGGTDLRALCSMLTTVAHSDRYIRDTALREDMKRLAAKINNEADTRNMYAHGVFLLGKKPNTYGRALIRSAANRISPELELITPKSLKRVADDAYELWAEAQKIKDRLKNTQRRRASPRKRP